MIIICPIYKNDIIVCTYGLVLSKTEIALKFPFLILLNSGNMFYMNPQNERQALLNGRYSLCLF